MNRRLTFTVLIMAIIPIGLLSWMGIAGLQAESERSNARIQYLGNQKLNAERDKIYRVFKDLETELDQLLDDTGLEIDELRNTRRDHNLVKQIFVAGKDELLYPSSSVPLSGSETDFLMRMKETDISFYFLQKSNSESMENILLKGWHTWFMGDGINFIYWRKDSTLAGEIVICGIELYRTAVLSRIINILPETSEANSSIRIMLIDVSGNTLYQWGAYSPPKEALADAVLPLDLPLKSWHLEYFANPLIIDSGSDRITLIGFLSAVLTVIIALSIYLYRESTRETREAARKVSFVNQVSHELKTPLTNIRLYAELLEEDLGKENIQTKKHLGIIISESRRLSRMIGNVLTFARDQKNGIRFNPAAAVPDEIIKGTLENFKHSLESKGIKAELLLNATAVVLLETDILEQILSNLISNVEKYAAEGGRIIIKSTPVGDSTRIIVSDNGPGIPHNLREKIFEPFYRISNKLTDGVAGTGIGLSLVRKLAKAHGGDARILQSKIGAVFEILLYTPGEEK